MDRIDTHHHILPPQYAEGKLEYSQYLQLNKMTKQQSGRTRLEFPRD